MSAVKSRIASKSGSAGRDENILSIYLNDINRVPLLSREEEKDLAVKARAGNTLARDRLAQANLRFVVNIAKKYQNQGLPLEDLISEGNIGLLNAVERFEVERGYHFISYAVWWIRQSILKAICEKSRMIRLPLNRANELVQIEKARKTLAGNLSEYDEIAEIAELLNLDKGLVAELTSISRDLVSLDTPVYTDRDTTSLGDFIEDSAYKAPEEAALDATLREDVAKVLATLAEKEASILRMRFGLDGFAPMSLKEVGDKFNLTKERIRQIEKKAIERLQQASRRELLEGYVA